MKVTGSNLQNACKLVFTLSKDEHNDPHFAKEGIVGEQDNRTCTCTVDGVVSINTIVCMLYVCIRPCQYVYCVPSHVYVRMYVHVRTFICYKKKHQVVVCLSCHSL